MDVQPPSASDNTYYVKKGFASDVTCLKDSSDLGYISEHLAQ